MTVKKSDINHICDLSKLRIDENEISIFTKQISDILNMINELEEADTNNIKPMAHPMNMSQRLRKDEAVLKRNFSIVRLFDAPKLFAGSYAYL